MSATISSPETLHNSITRKDPRTAQPEQDMVLRLAKAAVIMAAMDGCSSSMRKISDGLDNTSAGVDAESIISAIPNTPTEMGLKMADVAMDNFLSGSEYFATFVVTDQFHKETHDTFVNQMGISRALAVADNGQEWNQLETETGIPLLRSLIANDQGAVHTVRYRINPMAINEV